MFILIHCEEKTNCCFCHLLSMEQTRTSSEATKNKKSIWRRWLPLWHRRHLKMDQYYIIDVDCCLMLHASPWFSAGFLTSSCCLCNVYGRDTVMVWTAGPWLATEHHFQTTIMNEYGSKWPYKGPTDKNQYQHLYTRCAVIIKYIYRYVYIYISQKYNHIHIRIDYLSIYFIYAPDHCI